MILVDSNVLMYTAGSEHPFKARSVAFLERVAEGSIEAVIDAEALQEILHRYLRLGEPCGAAFKPQPGFSQAAGIGAKAPRGLKPAPHVACLYSTDF